MKRRNLIIMLNQLDNFLNEEGEENGIVNLTEELSRKVKGGYGNTNSSCENSSCGSGGNTNSSCDNSSCNSDNGMTNTGCTNSTCS